MGNLTTAVGAAVRGNAGEKAANSRWKFFWPDTSEDWLRVQAHQHSLRVLGGAAVWPDVNQLFYHSLIQNGLGRVIRWSQYRDTRIRVQTTLEHTYGIAFLAQSFPAQLNGRLQPPIDKEMLVKALIVHDIPECFEGDTLYENKNTAQDVREYLSWRQFIEGAASQLKFNRADLKKLDELYLLQFCLAGDEVFKFPVHAARILMKLREERRNEALWFRFLEHFDYVLYAEEQFVKFGNKKIMSEVATAQVPVLDQLSRQLTCLSNFWTPAASEYFGRFIK